MNPVNHNISELLARSGLSQDEFGRKHGSNGKSVWSYVSGRIKKPDTQFLLSICSTYGITMDVLTGVKLKFDRSGKIINKTSPALVRFLAAKKDYEKAYDHLMKVMDELIEQAHSLRSSTSPGQCNR